MRLLLVDDNPDDRALVVSQLRREFRDLDVIHAMDQPSFDVGLSRNPSLVVTDYQLRWTDGLQILRIIRSTMPLAPVVMFTGTGNEEVAVAAMQAGLDEYVIKAPDQLPRLRSAARSALVKGTQRIMMREQEDRLRAILETTADGIVTLDESGFVTSFNPAAERLFGYSFEDIAGESIRRLIPDIGSLAALVIGRGVDHRADATSGLVFEGQTRLGGHLSLDLSVSHTVLHGQGIYTCVLRDCTQRIRYEQGLIEARDRARQADLEKSLFLANMSHELRTPLNAVIGFAEMISQDELRLGIERRYVEYAKHIRDSGSHLLSLITDILEFTNCEVRDSRPTMLPVDLHDLLTEQVERFQVDAQGAGLTLSLSISGALPQVRGDGRRLRQVVMNLLSNAIKFTKPGGSIRVSGVHQPDGRVRFTMADTGMGMAPEDIPMALQPFRQLAPPEHRGNSGGVGLGLAIVDQLVQLHGGQLEIESELGRGTRISVILSPDQPDAESPQYSMTELTVQETTPSSVRRKKAVHN